MERRAGTLAVGFAFVALYLLMAFWGRELATGEGVTPWFPPPGVAVALLVAFGPRWAPAVVIAEAMSAAVVFDVLDTFTFPQYAINTAIVAGAYTIGPLILRERLSVHPALRRTRDIGWFLATCVILGPLLAAVGGSAVRAWADGLPDGGYVESVRTWWTGDALGVVTLAPALLLLLARQRPGGARPSTTELVAQGVLLSAAPALALMLDSSVPPQLTYLSLLPLLWVALRHGITGAAAGIAVLNVSSTIAAYASLGPTVELVEMQSFMVVVAVVGLYVGCVVSERRRAETELRLRAETDPLTGLPNRISALEWLRAVLASPPSGRRPALIVLDVDRFTVINNVRGHDTGDRLLCDVADRLRVMLADHGRLARMDADAFAVLTVDPGDGAHACELAKRMLTVFETPFGDIQLTASAGVAVAGPGDQTHDLLLGADLAVRAAQRSGRGATAVLDRELRAEERHRQDLEADLAHAIERGELALHYQPIVGLAAPVVDRWEALLRWTHPRHGLINTAHAIEIAEASGEIIAIGRWVRAEACRQAARWCADGRDPRISVNVSPFELLREGFADEVAGTLSHAGVTSANLAIEITENALIEDVERAIVVLSELRALGVPTAIDDFGTGYSSLTWLSQLPVNAIKLDRSFIVGATARPTGTAVVAGVIDLAHRMNLYVVAEGVEVEEQRAVLSELGCDAIQGWLTGRPESPDRVTPPDRAPAG